MVQSGKSLILPELTDEFAQTVGQFETVADFQKTVREQLEANRKDETDDSYFTALIDKVIEGATIKYPPQVLEFEVEHLMEHLKDDVSRQGMELDAYFKMIDKEREQYIDEEIRPAARKRLERSLVMDELAKAEEIKLEQDDYNQAISATVSQLQSQPKPRKAKEKVNSNLVNNLTMNELSRTFNVKVLERMKAIATAQAPEPEKTVEPEPVVAEVEPAKVKKAATSRKPRVPAEPKTE
jgi:trigger factor